ncbi:hypothetical protein [Marinobacter mobilis]|uniref:hypothetical protein n=1 Tax=Marinobacter mobilis TaxID=488533 RepID=UPI0035C6D0AD
MKKQAIVGFWVLLLTSLMSSAVMAQAVIKYEFFAEPYNFQLTGKQWGTIHGLNFEVRQSFGSLLGEPVTNNNVRYWFDGQEDGIHKPTVHLYREVTGTPQAQGIPYPNGDTWAIIELWGGDDISVSRTAGSLNVSYPFERFIDQVRVVSAHFVGNYGQINMLGGFNGVFGPPGSWGWNVPGSPSWGRALVSSFEYVDHGSRPIHWYSQAEARDLFSILVKECEPACQGQAQRLQDLNLNMYGVLNDIAAHSEDFRMAYYRNSPRTTMLNSLLATAQSEPDPQLRRRRQALAERAMEAFGDEQSRTFTQQQSFFVDRRKQSATEQAMAVTNDALCQMMTDGKVQEDTLGQLQQLVQQQGALPRQLQVRAEESLRLLSSEGHRQGATADLFIRLIRSDEFNLKLRVTRPGGQTLPGFPIVGDEDLHYVARNNPGGNYTIEVTANNASTNYTLRVQYGGKVITHEGYLTKGSVDTYEHNFDPNQADEGRPCQNFTEL